MDQSLKERLIGAAVLVALGVWLIPWLLDGRQEQANLGSSSSALRLPAPDGPLPVRSQTLALDAAKSDPFVADAARVAEPHSGPTTLAAAEPTTATTNAVPKPTQSDPPVAAPERVAAAAAKPASEPVAPQRVAAAAPKPTEPAAPSRAAAVTKAEAHGDWAVQLGVFSAEDNARRLAQKVNVYGYKPEVASYKSNGRAMYRVRLGPYVSRAEADATASALSAHSFPAQVVAVD